MKQLFVIFALFLSSTLYAQTYKLYKTENIHNQLKLNTKTGEIYQIQDDGQKFLVSWSITPENENVGMYTLRKTQNMWTYILLDTHSGRLWQIQYGIEGPEYRGSWVINQFKISETHSRKFKIQPMTSMYQFYLINEDTGDMWKFQWSNDGDEYRWIERF